MMKSLFILKLMIVVIFVVITTILLPAQNANSNAKPVQKGNLNEPISRTIEPGSDLLPEGQPAPGSVKPDPELKRQRLLPGSPKDSPVTLTIIHNNDSESQLIESNYGSAYGGVANFKSVADSLMQVAMAENRPFLMLSSGDNFLPGPELAASLNLPPGQPYYDAVAMDYIGFDVVGFGNHDFDFGPDFLEKFIRDYSLTQPVYIGANLDFSGEPGFQDLVENGRIRKSTVVTRDGTSFGIVGVITNKLSYLSSPGNIMAGNDMAAAAQHEIDSLLNLGINKIILVSHMQSVNEDAVLIAQLHGVDIAISGGGSELLTNDPSIALPGIPVYGPYPLEYMDADGKTVYVVTTPGEYTYIGNLKIEFDADGNVTNVDPASNPVLVTNHNPDLQMVEDVVDPVNEYIANLEHNIIATTEVTLDGIRTNVRTIETNEGDLVADAMLWQATQLAPSFGVKIPEIVLANGGGIRNNSLISAGSDISEFTTFSIQPFFNFVAVVEDVPATRLKEILENAVSRVSFNDGRFAQIAGFEFTWNPAGTAQIINSEGIITTPGTRVVEAKLANGNFLIQNGEVVPGAEEVTIATIDYLARGGDQYPFGNMDFTTLGVTDQLALFNFLSKSKTTILTSDDYPEGGNSRIINLNQQNVNVSNGWSIISGYIVPTNNNMDNIFSKVVTPGNLKIMFNQNGMYWPEQHINTFVSGWDETEGYKVKMNTGDYLILKGNRSENKIIDLNQGVNYMPVPVAHPVDAASAFSQIESQLIYAFDIKTGEVYWPVGGIFTLEQLYPGRGYLICMSASGSINFEDLKSSGKADNNSGTSLIADSPWSSQYTGNYHLISISEEALSGFETGDIIAVFNQHSLFAGQVEILKNGSNLFMLVSGDDNTTGTVEGLSEGDLMKFKLYSPSSQELSDLIPEFSSKMPGSNIFLENSASLITRLTVNSTSTGPVLPNHSGFEIYPNPSGGMVNLAISSCGNVEIKIISSYGREVYNAIISSVLNRDIITIDGSDFGKGVFFVKMLNGSETTVNKLIIR